MFDTLKTRLHFKVFIDQMINLEVSVKMNLKSWVGVQIFMPHFLRYTVNTINYFK